MTTIYVARAASGKYHWAHGPRATLCSNSGPRQSPSVRVASVCEVREAAADQFCKKCFQNGGAIQRAKSEFGAGDA